MKSISRIYDAILFGMAYVAGLLMVAMMLTIFIDVVLRNLNFQSSSHFFTFSEYALLLIPCFGAPWLVREKGHIYVELAINRIPEPRRQIAIRFVGLICVAICLILAWYGFEVAIKNFVQNDKDVRSFDMPRWMLVMWIPISFLMMAIEFGRFLWRRENFLAPLSDIGGD
jgi:TRAP-type C4-dicarboxylate transport system permease small subunit